MSPELFNSLLTLEDDVYRNIKSIRESQALFDDLSSSAEERDYANAATAGRAGEGHPFIFRPFEYGTVITYPFVPNNWQVTRFSDGTLYGVWYGSMDLETTVYETAYHWARFVRDSYATYDKEIIGERRVFRTRCSALLVDLRGKHEQFPGLVDPDSYTFTHQVGRYLHEQRQNGLLVKSARCDGMSCAILNPDVLSNPRDACYLTYRFVPTGTEFTVERAAGEKWLVFNA